MYLMDRVLRAVRATYKTLILKVIQHPSHVCCTVLICAYVLKSLKGRRDPDQKGQNEG